MDAVKKLTEDNSKEHEALRVQSSRAEKKVEVVLEAQRVLNGKHDTLRAEHDAFCVCLRQEVEASCAALEKGLHDTAEKLEQSITNVREALEARTAELETQCQVSTHVLS
jgi:hypothetical protein